MLLLTLLATVASAGNLKIDTSGGVMVLIDGTVHPFPEGRDSITAYALERGRHIVEVRNIMGRRLTELEVEVPWNELITLEYKKRHLMLKETELLPGHELPPEPQPGVVAQTTVVPAVEEAPKEVEVTLPDTVDLGSIEVVGSDTSLAVWVDGKPVEANKESRSYVVSGQFPREVPVKVTKGTKVLHDKPVAIKGNQNTRCLLQDDNTLNCRSSKPGLGQTSIQTTKLPPEHLKVVYEQAKAEAEAEAAANAPAGPVEVVFQQSDALDYCNIYIGGVKAIQFRNGDPTTKSKELVVGMHPLVIKNFTDVEVWAEGKLIVTPGEPIHVSFGPSGLKVDNREEAWTAY